MIRVEGLQFTYDGAPLLRGVDLQVAAGESAFLLGPSGSGKSTVLRCIAGLEQPTAGEMALDGRDLAEVPTHQRGIGMMMQEPALFPHLDVAANVAFGLRYHDVSDPAAEAHRFLELVGLAHRANASVDELSGGQRQRVSLARTLAARPRAVLLDEPLSSLDAALRQDLGQRIKDLLVEQGVPALWVTHDADEASRLGDRVWQLVHGRCVPHGS